ncbi:MAG: 2-C-methyl-D-erythritol 2,4-cyclodiphosphate synthase [Elusimicrobia bacterium]|nr:2-C-methyl-D-erythritol 2,4-cyclodiphosphate synthase [Elusimicrobiota bacterium]MBP9127301.1 2-C-methyl-D-erythritol 2,4-cyclodiphosphate synthase [Elusimicrobiota bacterium]MBP9698396.1 2-C-methyl-D-erythritol 2,4-cyclodiphosphate synthase [Elusimicrobiota bacterium]
MSYVGMGYDSHRFVKGRPLMLGGVRVPFEKGLAGHSDADVVLHAVIDALLGAAGMGDIGTFYSDEEARWKNADSLLLLADTFRRLNRRLRVVNVDVTVLAEEPRLGPYKNRMRAKMARVLKMSVDRVNVKAKSNEGMGWVGRKEGMAALATCALEKI